MAMPLLDLHPDALLITYRGGPKSKLATGTEVRQIVFQPDLCVFQPDLTYEFPTGPPGFQPAEVRWSGPKSIPADHADNHNKHLSNGLSYGDIETET